MWIFCGGMPRSGSTLQFQLTAHLVERAGLGRRVEWVVADEFPRLRARHGADEGWKVFKTHVCTDEMRAEFEASNARGVYVFRDVRDVVVSRMRKRDETFDHIWESGFLDRILTSFDRWTRIPGVLVSRYDAMVADVAGEVQRIAAHLGIAVDRDECEQVASEYTVPRQLERIRDAQARGALQRSGDAYCYDPISNLHPGHIVSGRAGEWRAALAGEEIAMLEDRARRWLAANGYPLALSAWHRIILKRRYARRRRPRVGTGT